MRWFVFVDGVILGNIIKFKFCGTAEELHPLVEKNRVPGSPIEFSYMKKRLDALVKQGRVSFSDGKYWIPLD